MVSLNDIRPLLHTARLFGCGFYIIKDDDIVMMKYGTFYSILSLLCYCAICAVNFYMLTLDDITQPRLFSLTVVRTTLSYVCVFTDILLRLKFNCKLQAAFSNLRIYDGITKYKEYKKSDTVRYIFYMLSFAILSYWSIVGYLTYRCEAQDNMFNAITYALINATLTMQLMTFVSLSFLLERRFRHLCEILLLSEDGKIMVMDRSNRQFRLQEAWWLHSCLTKATEMINSLYMIQLLLWISIMSFNTLSRVYTINERLIIRTDLHKAREVMLVSGCVANLFIVATICHITANQANRVGKIIFAPPPSVIMRRNFMQDIMEAAAYFQLRPVHFYAVLGIIRIDLPLLLSIASAITTYLVILHTANDT